METILCGKTEKRKLNNHIITVVVPSNPISYDKGVEKLEKIVSKIKKTKS